MGVERGALASGRVHLGEIGGQRLRRALQRPENVQALDVAAALPDRVDRRLAIEAGHRAILHHPGAADALHRLVGVARRPLADPVLADRRAEPDQRILVGVVAMVERAPDPHRQRQRRLGLDREVGEHRGHDRLVDEQRAEGVALPAMVDRLRDRRPHARGRADHAVEAGHRHHLEDGRDAPPFRPDHPAERAAQLRLARGIGDIAHLALQADDLQRVLGPVRAPARHEEAGEAAGRLGEHEKGVAHRRRDEVLVADELVSLPRAAGADRKSAGGVGAHVRAALLLGHRHADRQALLLGGRDIARVIDAGSDLRQPVSARGRAGS